MAAPAFLGLRTVIYPVPDLERARAWYGEAFAATPYFAAPFYVGFNIGGYELGLDPNASASGPGGGVAYWGVPDAEAAWDRMLGLGAQPHSAVRDVGEGIKTATVLDPFGNVVGLIENPHFRLPPAP